MSIQEALDIVQPIVLMLTAVAGASVAIAGLFAWRKQLKGRTEYELSRRLLLSAYRVRDEVAAFRSPIVSAGELIAAVEASGLPAAQAEDPDEKAMAAVRALRWTRVQNARSVLAADELEAEVLWGDSVKSALSPLHARIAEIHRARVEADFHASDSDAGQRAEPQRMIELRRILYGSGGETDQLARRLQEAIETVATFVKPLLKL